MASKGFTAARAHDFFSIKSFEQSSSTSESVLTGKEAREFYENIMKYEKKVDVSSSKIIKKDCGLVRQKTQRDMQFSRRARRRARAAGTLQYQTNSVEQIRMRGESEGNQRSEMSYSERSSELLGLKMLRYAHEGNTSGLKDLLSRGVDINFTDTFSWTAIMCACWSGQREVVKLLLQHRAAWVGVVDLQGRDARDLALEGDHIEVLEELESYGSNTQRDMHSDNSAVQPQWCDKCCSQYTSSLSSHLSSTIHQFSLRHTLPTPHYCLPPSSKSYKMMVRCGWKPGSGLGPEGEGPQQPVPTVLKRDQEGLGYRKIQKAKVTHFQARDGNAVKPPSKVKEERRGKGQRKEESRREEQNDRNWERDFRTSFYL